MGTFQVQVPAEEPAAGSRLCGCGRVVRSTEGTLAALLWASHTARPCPCPLQCCVLVVLRAVLSSTPGPPRQHSPRVWKEF